MTDRTVARRAELMLWAGVAAGLSFSTATLHASPSSRATAVPRGAVAVVDGRPISMADYAIAVEALGTELGRPRDDGLKRRAVERLIDDELMLERGLALDLVRRDEATRKALCDAVLTSERAPTEAHEPTDEELTRFYAEKVRKSSPDVPPLPAIHAYVVALYRRQAGDDAFAAHLAGLKKNASVRIATPLP